MRVKSSPFCSVLLAVYAGELIAGGRFTSAGGVNASAIARWDGATWQPVGAGMGPAEMEPEVMTLAIYNGELIAGGYFQTAGGVDAQHIARWDGIDWRPLGTGIDGTVNAMTVYDGDLYVGGTFASAGGEAAQNIARWDGTSWHALNAGLSGGSYPEVQVLMPYNGELIVGGSFIQAGSIVSAYWARWGCAVPDICHGDCDCDGRVDFRDIDLFIAAIPDSYDTWAALYAARNDGALPSCPFANCDADGDGHVAFADIDPFVGLIPSNCP